MEKVNWKVEGMTCSNCALTIGKYLQKEGMQQVKVNLIGGEVHFETVESDKTESLKKGITALGYKVVEGWNEKAGRAAPKMNRYLRYALLCSPFTLLLSLHMIPALHHRFPLIMNTWLQLALCLPVYVIGMNHFGRSAWKSIRNGLPNMNVLVALGASAAFLYSLAGTLFTLGPAFQYYETAATIIALVFLGNYLEDSAIETTQSALNKLARSQKTMANMIAYDEQHTEHIFPVENDQLRVGDLILVRSGDQVPADCKILWGEAAVNESIITGESLPVSKSRRSPLLGGSTLIDGTVKAQVTATAKDSVLANIIDLVKRAQGEKPPVQLLADRISAVFVPVVLGITALTFLLNYLLGQNLTESLMRSIAVLVIACPCAMGLATPAAIAVGLGRAARSGVLIRNAKSLEMFRHIRQVVFDKTGTLTTGKFTLSTYKITAPHIDDATFRKLIFSLEKYSSHPIAQCLTAAFKQAEAIPWKKMEEVKGSGLKAIDQEGNIYEAGSGRFIKVNDDDEPHNVYVTRNGLMIGWIDVVDELRPEASAVVQQMKKRSIRTVLLSGDSRKKCEQIAATLGIDEVYAEKSPEDKLQLITRLNTETPTVMVGDGINDAPALARSSVGISMSDAAHVAIQSADVVLMNNGLKQLPLSMSLGRQTYVTIKQNLFWAFSYNVLAIPVAALGMLGTYGPTYGALFMGLSDVVLAVNSVRLYFKKIN